MKQQKVIEANLKAMLIYDANNTCLTVEECASFLNVHPKTITNRIHAGKISAEFIGRIWRIPKMQFLKQVLEKQALKS